MFVKTMAEVLPKLHALVARPWFIGQFEQTLELLAADSHLSIRSVTPRSGRSALFYAQTYTMVKLLVDAGSSLEVRDTHGDTPLCSRAARYLDLRLPHDGPDPDWPAVQRSEAVVCALLEEVSTVSVSFSWLHRVCVLRHRDATARAPV